MKTCIIVQSKSAFKDTLFKPICGRTADGYIMKTTTRGKRVWLAGKEYFVNRHKVWCNIDKLENGKTWYSHAVIDEHLNSYLGFMAQKEAAEKLLNGEDYIVVETINYDGGKAACEKAKAAIAAIPCTEIKF